MINHNCQQLRPKWTNNVITGGKYNVPVSVKGERLQAIETLPVGKNDYPEVLVRTSYVIENVATLTPDVG